MRRFIILIIIVALSFAAAFASPDAVINKLSPPLRLLRALHGNPQVEAPQSFKLKAAASEIDVTIQFADQTALDGLQGEGLRLKRVEGKLAGAGMIYAAALKWDELERWLREPGIVQISSDWHPKVIPCLDLSAPEVGAPEVWQLEGPGGGPFTGEGQIVADFDTGVDVFHPALFRTSETRYDWIDVDQNQAFTPGVDVVDLDGSQTGTPNEIIELLDGEIYDPAMTFGGNGISNSDGVYQADWDWIYNDADGSGQREYGSAFGYTENDPGYGELIFIADDVNGNNTLDPSEQLILLDQSKVRAKMEWGSMVYERGVDLIYSSPDYNGHGTAVSGVLVGGEPGYSRLCGFAPHADLLMGSSSLSFAEYLPWVRSMGCSILLYEFGGWVFNFLDGSSNEELLLDSEAALGVMQVAPSGNLNRGFKHCQAMIEDGEDVTIQFDIEEYSGMLPTWMGSSYLWRNPDVELTFSLEDPYGFTIDLEGLGSIQQFGSWEVYSGWGISPRGTVEYDIMAWGVSGEHMIGSWILTVHHPGGDDLELNGYISDDASSWEGGAEFVDYRSNDKTVTWPATADSAFVLGSYSTRGYEQYVGVGSGSISVGDISLFSGRGTRIDGVHLLSLAAPGNYDVYTARSVEGYPYTHGGYRQFSGTSAAGPHVAGSAVLVWQAAPSLTRIDVEQLLESYAIKDEWTGDDYNDTWGHGKIRIADLVYGLGVPGSDDLTVMPDKISLTAYPNPFNATVALRFNIPDPGLFELAVYDLMGRRVTTLYDGYLSPGVEHFTWQAEDVPSGIYYVSARSGAKQAVSKVALLK